MVAVVSAAVKRAASASATVAVALTEEVAPEAAATASCAHTLVGPQEYCISVYTPQTDKLTPTEVQCVFHVDPDSPPKAPKT